ncbi:MAG: VCBS repeat-containing protein [Phycisphaerae bacterium]|jgi:hypothetical protein|nr:VCBS repeat-containing protein [Phycisphaerae bacterium]
MYHRLRLATLAAPAFLLVTAASAQQLQQQTPTRFPTQAFYSNQLTSADIDNDGDLDIIFADGQGYSSQGAALKPRIYVNNGAGFFTDQTDARAPGVTGWFRGVEAGDIDRDGDLDLVLAQDFNKQPLLLINDGAGAFADETATRLPALTMSSARAQFGDVDNDGDLDLFFCNSGATNRFGSGQPRLFLNDGTGVFTNVTATNIPAGNIVDQQDCIFADVDGDLDLDIHIGSRAGASKLWLNDGSGVFTNSTIPGGGATYSYDFGDVDNDGDMDLISIQGSADILLENNMPAAWTTISSEISPNTAIDDNDSKFFDFDNDGDLDCIVGSLGAGERVYRNNGGVASDRGALFTQVTNGATGIMPNVGDATLDIEVADYTGDGRLDVVTAQGESGNFQNRIYVNVTGPADSIAPNIVNVTFVADGDPTGSPAPHVVRTVIFDSHTCDRGPYQITATLHYAANGSCGTVKGSVVMDWVGNSMWRGIIPAMPAGAIVTYSVSAVDFAGNAGSSAEIEFTEAGVASILGDLTGDGIIDGGDLAVLLGNWDNPGLGDLDCDGTVTGADLSILLGAWSR